MNNKQALKEAQRRWGKSAMVQHNKRALTAEQKAALPPNDVRRWHDIYSVGRVAMGMFFEVCGSGDTWEGAFEKARQLYL